MVIFNCDNQEIDKVLRKLHKQVISNGGIVHEKMTISCKQGDFQITVAEEVPDGEVIISLPRECLLPADKYEIELNGYEIVMLSHDDDLSKGQVAMMASMIELFNLTGKIEAQKNTSTYSLQYEDKDLLERILKSRSKDGIPFLDNRESMTKQTYYLESFLMTRSLSIKEPGKGSGTDNVEVLMPIIDCLNHHSHASRFSPRYAGTGNPVHAESDEVTHITVRKSCPIAGSEECYVKYGPYDSMDAFIQYNYVDTTTFVVRSVPVMIDLPDDIGSIKIQSITCESQHKTLPDHLKDLEFYIPTISVNKITKVVSLSFLYIPHSSAPNAMRRVLALALNQLEISHDNNLMIDVLQFVEKQIIDENLKYFEGMSEYLESYQPDPAIKLIVANTRDVVAMQLKEVKNYKLLKPVNK